MNSALQADAHAVRCDLAAEVLRSSGQLRLRVTGWSMLPALWPGDTLVIDRSDADGITEGDVALFGRDRRFFVHRVVKKNFGGAQILTRGDAMPQPDPPFAESELLGKVRLIYRHNKHIAPRPRLTLTERAIALAAQKSDMAARAIITLRGLFQTDGHTSVNSN